MTVQIKQKDVLEANIYVHSNLVKTGQYQKSPHFRPENIKKVQSIITKLIDKLPLPSTQCKAIDFGCGTGFVINLLYKSFAEVHGLDITVEMMKEIDLSPGNIFLHESIAEQTSFPDNTFDFATAYSFMDHLFDYQKFLQEVYRVLKPKGVFYSDLNPNRDFILAMSYAEKSLNFGSRVVDREIKGALHNGEFYEKQSGVNKNSIEMAEPIKTFNKGFDFKDVLKVAKSIGFSQVAVEFDWFLGQGKVMHDGSLQTVVTIEDYLKSVLPASSFLYKYLRFIFIK